MQAFNGSYSLFLFHMCAGGIHTPLAKVSLGKLEKIDIIDSI